MELIEINKSPVKSLLPILLLDKTTGCNVIFATDAYKEYGFDERSQITANALEALKDAIQPRVAKSPETQAARTKAKAEVFTPSWIVNKMNNHCDEEWFGRKDVFNMEKDQDWQTNAGSISFENTGYTWQDYVLSKRIEITCGEAPYIVSRYDASTGNPIAIENRIGILDRKLRVINENTRSEDEWLEWTRKAYQSVYGYEFQGDSPLIARINLLLTFTEYYGKRYGTLPEKKHLTAIAQVIAWNIWQMDGLKGTVPFAEPQKEQPGLFDFMMEECSSEKPDAECKVMDWQNKTETTYIKIREGK